MTLSLLHAFVSAKANGPDATLVQATNWNAQHSIAMTGPALVGRTDASQGAATEITLGAGLSLVLDELATTPHQITGPALLGRTDPVLGNVAEIALGSNVALSSDTLNVVLTGPALVGRTTATLGESTEITPDTTISISSDTIGVASVPVAKVQLTGPSLAGRTTASLGSATEITLDTTVVLSSNVLSVGDIPVSHVQLTGPSLAGRTTASLGDATDIALDSTIVLSSNVLSVGDIPFSNVQLTGPALLGRTTASLGDAAQVTLGTGLDLTSDVLSATAFYDTKADAEAATIPAAVNFLILAGRTEVGIGGGLYAKVVAEPTHAGKLQSADGAWWELSEPEPNVMMFGVDMTGATDSASAFTDALEYGATVSGKVSAPSGVIRLDTTISVPHGVTFYGVGMPGSVYDAYPTASTSDGTWIFFNHEGNGLVLDGSDTTPDSTERNLYGFGTYREQPIAGVGAYTPNLDNLWDIVVVACTEVYLSDILLLNPTRGIYVSGSTTPTPDRGSGRICMRRIFGQPLYAGIQMEYVYDTCHLNEIHFWPFWSLNQNVFEWTYENAVGLIFGRVDNLFSDQIFIFTYLYGIWVVQTATVGGLTGGTLGNAGFGVVHCDAGNIGLVINSGADAATMVFDQFITYKSPFFTANTNPTAFKIDSNICNVRIGDLKCAVSGSHMGEINGTSNFMRIGHLDAQFCDQLASGAAQFQVASGNRMQIDGWPYTDAADDKLVGGNGTISCNLWRSYSPTVAATSGTFTSVSAEGSFRRVVDTVDVRFEITITTNGTAAGSISLTLPSTANASTSPAYSIGTFRDITTTGKMGQALIVPSATTAALVFYDNTYPGASGVVLGGNVTYRAVSS